MKRLLRVATVTGLAALLAVVTAATGTVSHAEVGPASASDRDHRAPAVKSVFRRYGGWAVEQAAWNQTVKITFRGRRGDVVGARTGVDAPECQQVGLATGAGRLVRQGRSDFWVLPELGRYVLTYTQDCVFGAAGSGDDPTPPHQRALSVQLLKVRTHRLVPDDGLMTLPVRRGYVDVAELRLRGKRPVEVRALAYVEQGLLTGEFDRIVTPTSTVPVRRVGQVVDGDECFERAPVTITRGRPMTGSTYYVGADGLYPVAAALRCDRDARRHVAARGDIFWLFNEERALEVEVVRLR